jgi:thioredoxin 1
MSAIAITSDDRFETDVLKASRPVLVDFGADWCPPCRAIAPHLEDLAKTGVDQLSIVKVDVDGSPETAMRYGIRGLPTLIVFRDGEPVARRSGALPKRELQQWVEAALR